MARIIQAGWEIGDVAYLGAATSSTGVLPVVAAATPTPRSGAYSLKVQAASAGSLNFATMGKLLVTHASKTELYYAFALYRSDTEANTLPSRTAFATYDTVGNVNTIVFAEGDGSVRAYYAPSGAAAPSMGVLTLIGASGTSIPNLAWTLIEVRLVAATGATGTCQVKINGTLVIDVSSVRTCQTNANFGAFHLGFGRNGSTGANAASFLAFDDLRVNDNAGSLNTSWPGDEKIRLLVPTGAGDLTQLSRGGADSGSNWSQVDEVPPTGGTDYVTGASAGLTDLYATTDFPVAAVSAISVLAQVANSDGAGGTVNLPVKTTGAQSDGSAYALTAAWTYQTRLLETDPTDAAAWTSAKLAALQIGCRVAS